MLNFLKAKVAYDEEVSDEAFTPSHPRPHEDRLRMIKFALAVREDFLTIFCRFDYNERVTESRLFGRKIFVVNDRAEIKYVLATRHDNFERKTPQMRRALEKLIGDGLFISDGETWKSRRPLVSDIVHKNKLPVFGKVMERACERLIDRWSSLADGDVINAHSEMARLTADIIARSVFGNDLEPGAAHDLVDGFGRYQEDVDAVNLAYLLGNDEGRPVRMTAKIRAATDKVVGVINKVVSAHLSGEGDRESMVEAMVRQQEKRNETGLTLDGVRNEAATIFMAGYETTASTLTWALYCVAKSPWVEAKMLSEIKAVCGDRRPEVGDVPALSYCSAVIDETLRLYPPVPILGRQARDDDVVGGLKVPAASLMLVIPWLLHRTPSIWPEPNRFRPERFLEGRPAPYTYLPFAAGPRICAGLAFGHTEATLCLATLVQAFHLAVAGGQRVDPFCRLTLRPKGGMPMTLSRRRV